jgi:hypothetical protein
MDFRFMWTQKLHELKNGKFHQNQHPSFELLGLRCWRHIFKVKNVILNSAIIFNFFKFVLIAMRTLKYLTGIKGTILLQVNNAW